MPTVIVPFSAKSISMGLEADMDGIMGAIGPRALAAQWKVHGLAYGTAGVDTTALEERMANGELIEGSDLSQNLEHWVKVRSGTFRGFDPGVDASWVEIRAVDGEWWEVTSNDRKVLDAVRENFDRVVDKAEWGQLEIMRKYRALKRRLFLGAGVFGLIELPLGYAAVMNLFVRHDTAGGIAGLAFCGFAGLVFGVYVVLRWRCPACNALLGMPAVLAYGTAACPACEAKLQ